jgi:succinate dehydrogenase / fumarate reductase iron-sulfur subunit
MDKNISFTIKYWKQNGPKEKGHFESREMKDIPGDTSFLEMLDILNEQLIEEGKEPFVFDHDCREGICGMCSLYINGTSPRQNRARCYNLPALHAPLPRG